MTISLLEVLAGSGARRCRAGQPWCRRALLMTQGIDVEGEALLQLRRVAEDVLRCSQGIQGHFSMSKQGNVWTAVKRSAREASQDFFAPIVGAVRGIQHEYKALDAGRRRADKQGGTKREQKKGMVQG